MRQLGTFALAFTLGACVTAATTSVASVDEPSPGDSKAFVRTTEASPHRVAPSGSAQVALLARGEQAFVGLLQMDGGGAVPTHRDATEEFIYVLDGGGTITIDGTEHTLQPGSIVYMPAHAEVSYANGPEPLVAVQVFADPDPADKYDAWSERP